MDKWAAVTESGTKYDYEDGYITISRPGSTIVQRPLSEPIQVLDGVDRPNAKYPWAAGDTLWKRLEGAPKVGQHLYTNASVIGWRLSTPIQKVIVLS